MTEAADPSALLAVVERVAVGERRRLEGPTFRGDTGIFKVPRTDAVEIGESGVAGDVIIDTRHHGGPDQAVYLYRSEDYDWFSARRDTPIDVGSFGENLTLRGLPDASLPIGTRLVSDELELEITAPRIPCRTLAQRMDDAGFVKAFLDARRPGFYARVPRPGSVRPGQAFRLVLPAGPQVTTVEVFEAVQRRLSLEEVERLLSVPIDARTRADLDKRRARLTAAGA